MKSFTINLREEKVIELTKKANQLGISTQELIDATFDDLLSKPDKEFEESLDYILNKNKNLYKKLAQ